MFHISFHKCRPLMQRKRRRRISAGPWLSPKKIRGGAGSSVMPHRFFSASRCRNIPPSLWEECPFVRSSRTGNNENIIATLKIAVKIPKLRFIAPLALPMGEQSKIFDFCRRGYKTLSGFAMLSHLPQRGRQGYCLYRTTNCNLKSMPTKKSLPISAGTNRENKNPSHGNQYRTGK